MIEAFGGVLIMKSLGRENPERTFLGIALAVGTLGFTAFVSKTATDTVHTKDAGARRTLGSIALLAVYTVFVLAVAAARVELPEGEDGVDLLTYAEAILMVATTVLPAFTAEWIFRMRAPAVRAARALRNVRGRIRRLEAKHLQRSQTATHLRDWLPVWLPAPTDLQNPRQKWRKHRGIERATRVKRCRELSEKKGFRKEGSDRMRTKTSVWLPAWLPAVAVRREVGRSRSNELSSSEDSAI